MFAACSDKPQQVPPGTVRFEAQASGYAPPAATRTAYSGETTEGVERIDWVDGDRVLVWCANAENPDSDAPVAQYSVSNPVTASPAVSSATLTPSSGTGLVWGTGDHTFYAMYPAPVSQAPAGASFTEGTMVFPLPEAQHVTFADGSMTGAPDMSLAPMLARSATVAPGTQSVALPFVGQYTTYQFTVSKGANDVCTLKGITLTSQSGALSGTFTVPADHYNDPESVSIESGNQRLSLDWSAAPVVLNAASPSVTFTLMAVPQAVSGLRITISTDEVGDRSLTLQTEESETLGFPPYRKYVLSGMYLPLLIDASIDDPILWDHSISILDNVVWWMAADPDNVDWFGTLDRSALTWNDDRTVWWVDSNVVDVIDWNSDRERSDLLDTPDNIGWEVDSDITDEIGWESFGGIELTSTDAVSIWRNQSYIRSARALSANGTDTYTDAEISWSITTVPTEGVASVNETTGRVTAYGPGIVTVTATATPNHAGVPASASYTIYVNTFTSVTLNATAASLTAGDSLPLTATVTYTTDGPAAALPDDLLLWQSSETDFISLSDAATPAGATVTATGVAAGASTVTVSVNPIYADGLSDQITLTCTSNE